MDPFTIALISAGVSTGIEGGVKALWDVESAKSRYYKSGGLLDEVQKMKVPKVMTAHEIRTLVNQRAPAPTSSVMKAAGATKAAAMNKRGISVKDRNNRSIRSFSRRISEKAHGVNALLRLQKNREEMKDTALGISAMTESAKQGVAFKNELAKMAAARALDETEREYHRRERAAKSAGALAGGLIGLGKMAASKFGGGDVGVEDIIGDGVGGSGPDYGVFDPDFSTGTSSEFSDFDVGADEYYLSW